MRKGQVAFGVKLGVGAGQRHTGLHVAWKARCTDGRVVAALPAVNDELR